jgi:hypothetical protein
MAASAAELRKIYSNLFDETDDQDRLSMLKTALERVDRRDAGSRTGADRVLELLNGGQDPGLTFTQLECLRSVLSAQTFAPLMPGAVGEPEMSEHLVQLYRLLFSEPDLAHLRALQQAVFDYDKSGTDDRRIAVLDLLRELNPDGHWNDSHVGALDALLVRDIAFKQIAPFQVSGDFW